MKICGSCVFFVAEKNIRSIEESYCVLQMKKAKRTDTACKNFEQKNDSKMLNVLSRNNETMFHGFS